MTKKWFLIVRGDGSKPRIGDAARKPKLRADEIALTFALEFPAGWQQVYTNGPVIRIPPPPSGLKIGKT